MRDMAAGGLCLSLGDWGMVEAGGRRDQSLSIRLDAGCSSGERAVVAVEGRKQDGAHRRGDEAGGLTLAERATGRI